METISMIKPATSHWHTTLLKAPTLTRAQAFYVYLKDPHMKAGTAADLQKLTIIQCHYFYTQDSPCKGQIYEKPSLGSASKEHHILGMAQLEPFPGTASCILCSPISPASLPWFTWALILPSLNSSFPRVYPIHTPPAPNAPSLLYLTVSSWYPAPKLRSIPTRRA